MSRINLHSFIDANHTGHGSEVLNGLFQRFRSPLRDLLFRRFKREKTSGIQGRFSSSFGTEVMVRDVRYLSQNSTIRSKSF